MDLFDDRAAEAMLIGREEQAFDSPDYIYELKLDGDRCLAYLDPAAGTELINKRGRRLLPNLPELAGLHLQTGKRCILDGELVVGSGQKEEFGLIRSRVGASDPYRIKRLSREYPASFVAFDILYLEREALLERPLLERKKLLRDNLAEDDRLALSRYIEEKGGAMFKLVVEQGLEGIVAKRADSLYQPGKRSRDWVKIKNWAEDDFVICGYWPSQKANVVSLVLGQFRKAEQARPELVYKGHVVLGRQTEECRMVESQPRHPGGQTVKWGRTPAEHPKTVWLQPLLVCKVEYLCLTPGGGLRQPVFRGLRDDKSPEDCLEPERTGWPHKCGRPASSS